MAPKFSKALKAKKFATAAAKRSTAASSISSMASRVTKPMTKAMGMGSMSSSTGKWINWILIIALVALLVFTIVYVVNIHKMADRMEGFIDDIAVAEGTAPAKMATSGSGYKLVYMYSKTCPHCVEFTPTFDEFTRQLSTHSLAGKVSVEKIERSDANAAAYLKMVEGFPSVLLIKDNELKEMMVGKTDLATIKTFVERNAI